MDGKTSSQSLTKQLEEKWQNIVYIMSKMIDVPAGLIMRLNDDRIEVHVSSQNEKNPYNAGNSEFVWGSGLYCEHVIKSQEKLLVPNALNDPQWKNNPDIKLNMISYLGLPINYPDKKPYGTICVLDSKENHYSALFIDLMNNFRDLIESQLEIIYMNENLGDTNYNINDYTNEIRALREICPTCQDKHIES